MAIVLASFSALYGLQLVSHAIWWCQVVNGGPWWSPGAAGGLPGGNMAQNECLKKFEKGCFLHPGGGLGVPLYVKLSI